MVMNAFRPLYFLLGSIIDLANIESRSLDIFMTVFYLIGVELTEFFNATTLAKMFYDQAKDYQRKEVLEEIETRTRNLSELLSTNFASKKITYVPFQMNMN